MDKKREKPFWKTVFWGYVLSTPGFPIMLLLLIVQIIKNTKEIFNNKGRK